MGEHLNKSLAHFLTDLGSRLVTREQSDAELLKQIVDGKREMAFEELVRRYGKLVMGVCQRVLNNHSDAEDAFQATFLVLAKKAASIRKANSLASWLYGVAFRTAKHLKTDMARRRRHESEATKEKEEASMPGSSPGLAAHAALDECIRSLPTKYRQPVLLCFFQDLTYEEAASRLGWTGELFPAECREPRSFSRNGL